MRLTVGQKKRARRAADAHYKANVRQLATEYPTAWQYVDANWSKFVVIEETVNVQAVA